MCSRELHESFKGDAATWRVQTYPVGLAHGYEWGNCRSCHSTLLRPVAREARS